MPSGGGAVVQVQQARAGRDSTGEAPPGDLPSDGVDDAGLAERAIALTALWIERGQRLDMQGLADALGVSRVTVFRRVGGREVIMGESLWVLAQRTLRAAERRFEAAPYGRTRSAGVLEQFNTLIAAAPGLRCLLDKEPALALRVLTDPRGLVQPRAVAAIETLLRRDMSESGLTLLVEPHDLSFALVRLCESFLYADVLASRTPDVAVANRLQRALIESAS